MLLEHAEHAFPNLWEGAMRTNCFEEEAKVIIYNYYL